jgi:hypothetical protein
LSLPVKSGLKSASPHAAAIGFIPQSLAAMPLLITFVAIKASGLRHVGGRVEAHSTVVRKTPER